MIAVLAASTLLLGNTPAPARADPPEPASSVLPPGWSLTGKALTWTSDKLIPPGDAAVEFWSGDRLLGRARGAADLRTFTLPGGVSGDPADLQVRIGGERADASAPAPQRRVTGTPSAVPVRPAHSTDPGVPGRYATTTGEYTLPGITLSTYPAKVEMQAVVVAPTNAPGKRPLALFLHGRHWTCYSGPEMTDILLGWPCPAGSQAVPSHRGYLQSQRLLASQGYVTVSISANGINGQDTIDTDGGAQTRSSLIREHLAHWADWSGAGRATAPAIVRSAPRADLDKVLLVGHSRGGEGINRAAIDSLTPPPAATDDFQGTVRWTIRGLVPIGPTAFGQNPQPDVPSATILPGCDGDVRNLQGQMYVDATRGVSSGRALHSSVYLVGTNHNYFNTEWTPGQAAAPSIDDFQVVDDPVCTAGVSSIRLTAEQQQTAGATYVATAARLFVAGDERARPLLDGSGVRAPSAGPARALTHAIGANRTPVIVPDPGLRISGAARLCEHAGRVRENLCDETFDSPHFVPLLWPEEGRWAVALTTGTATLRPATPMPVAGAQSLAMRLVVPPNAPATPYRIAVTDDRGRRLDLGTATLTGLPDTEATKGSWAQEVRLALPRDVRAVTRLDITSGGTGTAYLIDAWGWRPGVPDPRPAALDRVDVGEVTAVEGDSGSVTWTVPVAVRGKKNAVVRFFLGDSLTAEVRSWTATVRPGTERVEVPVTGDTIYGGDRRSVLAAKAVSNAVIGDYDGGVRIREDDPMPAGTVTPSVTAAEGTALTWTITLSEPAGASIYLILLPRVPQTGPELSTTDVDPDWFTANSSQDPEPSRPLSGTSLQPFLEIPAGTTSIEFTVPTITDPVTEGDEHVRFATLVFPPDFSEPVDGPVFDGTVTD
ncbi:hypothetical protein GCM10009828_080370 [Actinoplanes couchii]|uniref:Secreted protein n=2 Tax=Actinoplanes couchii TaxID=403638 RepID=A0ABQ3XK64_9ACTN|nr:hypothetical protein Aco03nite_072880 [Actinoplanes couchii]